MKPILLAVFIGLSASASVWAQATAQMSGTVRDQSGAVLPGVEVTATQTNTGISRMTITNETGSYIMPNLALGPYRLEAALPGFRTFVQTGIVLQVNSNAVINPVLEVGQVSEQVEVQANASLVETRSVGVGSIMESERITELPLNGRNAQELLVLSGAAVEVTTAGGFAFPNRLMISSAGSLGFSTDYRLDGIRHIDPYDGRAMPLPFPDALAEFKAETGGLSAQQGRGSSVSAVTKSGTNEFHGDLFEFVRNDLFNARNYFAIKGSTLKRNQFGGTLGGPIQKSKLFFFGGYQGTIVRQDPADMQSYLPTAAMLAGDFTAFASPGCNGGRIIALRAPFVNNRIDPALFSPAAVKLSARLPKSDDPCGLYTYGRKSPNNNGILVSKVDYQLSDKQSLFGRLLWGKDDNPSPFTFTPDNPLNAINGETSKTWLATMGDTYLLNSTTVNAFRLSVNYANFTRHPPEYFDVNDLGIRSFSYLKDLMNVTVTSGFALAGAPGWFRTALYQVSDDVSMTRGTHQFGFGGHLGHARTNQVANVNSAGAFNFNGAQTGLGLADFMTGRVSDFNQGLPNESYARVNYLALYAQDAWQVKRRLTMSYGLRWAPNLPITDYRRPVPTVMNFDINRYRQGQRSNVFVNAPPGMLFPGDPGFQQKNNGLNAEKPMAEVFDAYWFRLAPRLGLAWDVEGNGRTSIRASYGLAYEDYPTNYRLGTQIAQPPWGAFTRLLVPAGGFDDPWRGITGGNPHPIRLTKDTPFVPLGDYQPSISNLAPTYTESWNLSFQREIVPGTLLSASYLGTLIIHIQAAEPLNPAVFIPGNGDAGGNCFLNGQAAYFKVAAGTACSTVANTQARRKLSLENPAFSQEIGRMGRIVNGGTQNYHGMLLSIQRRPSRGINLNGNYTWSHCIGDYSGRSNSGYGTSADHTYQDPNNRRRDRGNCEADQRHALNLTAVAETPQFANRTMRVLGAGWRLSGIYRVSSAGNIVAANASAGIRTVTLGAASAANNSASGVDRCLCDISSQRPDKVLENVYLNSSGRPLTQYLNPAAFGPPALGTLGNMGRTNLKLPATWQFDIALARVFRVRESQSLEFRAEAYNVTNSFRSGSIVTNLSSSQFGQIRIALAPRITQFALKYLF